MLPEINRCLLQLVESGLVELWKHYFSPEFRKVDDEWRPLTVYHLIGPFLAWQMGIFVAVSVLIVEFHVYYLSKIKIRSEKLKL